MLRIHLLATQPSASPVQVKFEIGDLWNAKRAQRILERSGHPLIGHASWQPLKRLSRVTSRLIGFEEAEWLLTSFIIQSKVPGTAGFSRTHRPGSPHPGAAVKVPLYVLRMGVLDQQLSTFVNRTERLILAVLIIKMASACFKAFAILRALSAPQQLRLGCWERRKSGRANRRSCAEGNFKPF